MNKHDKSQFSTCCMQSILCKDKSKFSYSQIFWTKKRLEQEASNLESDLENIYLINEKSKFL